MKKFFVIVVLLLIIVFSFGFAWLKSQAQGAENNYFNSRLREKFARIPLWRTVLGLHYDGDAKADYLGHRYRKILIEVDVMDKTEVNLAALDLLVEKIAASTGKPTTYLVSDQSIPYKETLNSQQIGDLVTRYRNHQSQGDTAAVYLLYGSRDEHSPSLLGSTYREDGIILFEDSLQQFTAENPKILADYEESTALHEFGHQLGLPHNNVPFCLMNERADEILAITERPGDAIVDFCKFEKDLIQSCAR